ncbi:MAG: hypothetical protein ABSF76_00265 [Opitutaceae bacterium]|jgi:hypothetical protein
MKHAMNQFRRAPCASIRLASGLGLLSLSGFLTPSVSASPAFADISLNINLEAPPPPPRREVIIGVSPGPGFVWIGGYWDGGPGHYAWVGGRWASPPHGHGRWNPPHWDKGRDGHYHQTKGEWRDDGPKH